MNKSHPSVELTVAVTIDMWGPYQEVAQALHPVKGRVISETDYRVESVARGNVPRR